MAFPNAPQKNYEQPSLQSEVTNLTSRIRLLEERQGNIQRKIHLMESNMLSSNKELRNETKVIHAEMLEIKRAVKDFEDTIKKMSASLEDLASREEVKLIERYVNLLDPSNFISRKQLTREVERAVEQALEKRHT